MKLGKSKAWIAGGVAAVILLPPLLNDAGGDGGGLVPAAAQDVDLTAEGIGEQVKTSVGTGTRNVIDYIRKPIGNALIGLGNEVANG